MQTPLHAFSLPIQRKGEERDKYQIIKVIYNVSKAFTTRKFQMNTGGIYVKAYFAAMLLFTTNLVDK